MKHYGDITKINGAKLPIVDIITGGSPCQDLSVAGKRAGLAGERSGLFMEQIRIIKEMRNECLRQLSMRGATYDMGCIQPRYMVWENVPGAFSSNKGEDFRCVLEETARIVEKDAIIPRPKKWENAGCIVGNGWSIAYRVHDAQYWGVPQRRRRLCLVADFNGESAGNILFELFGEAGEDYSNETYRCIGDRSRSEIQIECKSVSRDIEKSREKGQEIAKNAERSIGNAIGVESFDNYNLSLSGEIAKTLQSEAGGSGVNEGCVVIDNHPQDSRFKIKEDGIFPTMGARQGGEGDPNTLMVLDNAYCVGNGQLAQARLSNKVGTLNCMHDPQCVMYANEAYDKWSESEKSASLRASGGVYGGGSESLSVDSIVRRLTPTECERLQCYPDGWTDIGDWTDSKGKIHKTSDTARYKALGNSIALPFWQWLADRMVNVLNEEGVENPTMGSLFSGIGGFELVYKRAGCEPIWNSEIESFPEAVTTKHFGDDDNGVKGDVDKYL